MSGVTYSMIFQNSSVLPQDVVVRLTAFYADPMFLPSQAIYCKIALEHSQQKILRSNVLRLFCKLCWVGGIPARLGGSAVSPFFLSSTGTLLSGSPGSKCAPWFISHLSICLKSEPVTYASYRLQIARSSQIFTHLFP